MRSLMIELIENGVLCRSDSEVLHTGKSMEFIGAMVLICNKLEVDVPVWTYREEKNLSRKKQVMLRLDDIRQMRISISE